MQREKLMAAKRSSTRSSSSPNTTPAAVETTTNAPIADEWMAQAVAQGIKPEHALACIGLGLMQKMTGSGAMPWIWSEAEDGGQADVHGLRQRLELVNLALNTGAPLSTAEVTLLLGARPGTPDVERGGLRARRLGRNVWTLSRASEDESGAGRGVDSLSSNGFVRRF